MVGMEGKCVLDYSLPPQQGDAPIAYAIEMLRGGALVLTEPSPAEPQLWDDLALDVSLLPTDFDGVPDGFCESIEATEVVEVVVNPSFSHFPVELPSKFWNADSTTVLVEKQEDMFPKLHNHPIPFSCSITLTNPCPRSILSSLYTTEGSLPISRASSGAEGSALSQQIQDLDVAAVNTGVQGLFQRNAI